MTADKLRILGDLWASNAFGDVTEWRKLGGEELRAECAGLHAHWVSLGYSVGSFNAQDMLEYLHRQWQPRTFLIGDEHVSDTTVQADSLEDALELARDWARDGSWDHRCEVDVFAVELDPLADDGRDRRGAEVGDRTWTTVEVAKTRRSLSAAKPTSTIGRRHTTSWGACARTLACGALAGRR